MAKTELKNQLESYEGYINDIPLIDKVPNEISFDDFEEVCKKQLGE